MDILNNISVILCDTSHNGNIGSVARSMKTMGLHKLILVNPKIMPDDHSIALASNAADVVENAVISSNLADTLSSFTYAYALTSRKREFNQQLQTPREASPEIISSITANQNIALVFGSERTGLTIEQQELCNRLITIPANPNYPSLNLSHAVQIVAYEIFSQLNLSMDYLKTEANKATIADLQGILTHIEQALSQKQYFKTEKNREMFIRRMQNILYRTDLNRNEVDLVRGVLSQIMK